jgi:folylpolyglutamate synthase/dihydrofolate synthase/anthranilate synthase/aminodeoxychorismate synthase-like glutamine amidotransferase
MPLPAAAAEALAGLEMFGVRLGLVRMRRLLAALGDPQRRVPAVLVAGSNGKGSTAALLAAMAAAAGYRTGLYTSPHLERVEERLRIDGRPVDGGRLGRWILEVLDAAGRVLDEPPTYFETLTAAAFAELAAAEVELAVVEVGLGGRLDATNLAEPALSLVTPISLEHREHLGDTLGAIAVEKAGVMRAGRPTVAWTAEPEVAAALGRAAREAGAGLVMGPEGVEIVGVEPRGAGEEGFWSGQRIELGTARGRYRCDTPLLGAHQARNLAHAALAAEMLAGLDPGRGQGRGHGWGRIDAAAIERGAAEVDWPGRLEPVVALPALGARPSDEAAGETASGGENALGERRLPRRALLDVAHNPVTTLRAGFDEAELDRLKPDLVVLSPGPGRPADFDVAGTVKKARARQMSVFGVCLGLQGIVEHAGGALGVLDYPMHGKPSRIHVRGGRLFEGLPREFRAGRYHSLYALRDALPARLSITAETEDGVIMAVEHTTEPIAAVQFHPESILTLEGDVGLALLENVVERL